MFIFLGHITCRDCNVNLHTDRCPTCQSPSLYFRNLKVQGMIECGSTGNETCGFCNFTSSYGGVMR